MPPCGTTSRSPARSWTSPSDTARRHGAIGARMTGGGFGGSAIALTPAAAEQQVRAAVERAFAEAGYAAPEIFSVRPAAGAMRLA